MMKPTQILLSSIFVLLLSTGLWAQQGTIRGTVSDKSTGEVLMFSNVVVKGTDPIIGGQTDLDGNYTIKLAPGTYDLEFSYVGYTTQTVTGVEVKENDITIFDFLMSSDAVELDLDIVVQAERIDRTENALLVLQMKAPAIQDGISAQEISRYGSSNAAESMKRVTGASVQDGRYIVVRGLGDRYSNAQLNGLQLPSTDPYRNSTQLDLIPANVLDNVIASKTFTPDMPGNFAGGNVNIKTKSFPERFTLSASLSASYNTQSSFIDDFLTHQGGDTDWLGYDDGTRDVPAILQDPKTRSELKASSWIFGPRDEELGQLIDDASKSLNPQLEPTTTSVPLNHGASFSVGNQFDVANRPLGVLVGVSYSKSYNHYSDGAFKFWEVNPGGEELVNDRSLSDTQSAENATIGGLVGLAYKISPSNKISFNALYNHDGIKSSRALQGAFPSIISGSGVFQTRSLLFVERELSDFQLQGEHALGNSKNAVQFDWAANLVSTSQSEPDFRLFANTFRERNGDRQYFISPAEYDLPFHFFRTLSDQQWEAKGDFTIPFAQEKSSANKIKFGAAYRTKDRTFEEDQWQIINFDNVEPYDGSGNDFFERNAGMLTDEGSGDQTVGLYPISQRDIGNSYDGTESVFSAYGMVTYDWTRFKVIAGVRLENTDISVISRDTSFSEGQINQLDVLPSLNLVYRLTENMNLRASATQTLARPNMRELAPFTSFDFIGGFRLTGNPELKRTLIQNYDFRWEYFFKPGEVIAVSAYYKDFTNPIVQAFLPRAANPELQFQNVDQAEVYGVEFEFRKRLGFISPALENLKFSTNLSYIQSEVKIPGDPNDPDSEAGIIQRFNPEKGLTRPFAGQSPFLLNVALNYTNPESGWDALLAFNIFGRRLAFNSPNLVPDVYETPIPQLDLTVSKNITDRISAKVSVQNILNRDFRQVMEYRGTDYDIRRFRKGVDFGMSLSYKI